MWYRDPFQLCNGELPSSASLPRSANSAFARSDIATPARPLKVYPLDVGVDARPRLGNGGSACDQRQHPPAGRHQLAIWLAGGPGVKGDDVRVEGFQPGDREAFGILAWIATRGNDH